MTAVPQALEAPAKKRVSGDVPADVARRLDVWAALRGKPAAHIVAELVIGAVPDDDGLRALIGRKGAGNGHAES